MIALVVLLAVCAGLLLPLAPPLADLLPRDLPLWSALCCSAGLVGLLWSTWVTGRVGENSKVITGWDVPVFRWLTLALAAGMTTLSAVRLVRGHGFDHALSVGFAAVAGFSLLGAIVIELIGPLLPVDLVPESVRRATFEVGSGEGIWAAAVLGCIGTLATSERLREAILPSLSFASRRGFDATTVALVSGLTVAMAVFALSRYMPWVMVSLKGDRHGVPGWALPFIGPLSLGGLLAFIVGSCLTLLGRAIWGVMLTSAAALLVTATASIFWGASRELSDSGLVERLAHRLNLGDDLAVLSANSAPLLQYSAVLLGALMQILVARRLAAHGGAQW